MKFIIDRSKQAIKDKKIFHGLDYDPALEREFLKDKYLLLMGFSDANECQGGAVVSIIGDEIEFHLFNFTGSKEKNIMQKLFAVLKNKTIRATAENNAMARFLERLGFKETGGAYVWG